MNRKKFSTNSGTPVNFRRSSGSCSGDAHRAGVQVTDAHHHAAHDDERSRGEAEFLGAEERPDDDVAAGFHLAVHLHHDAVAQLVEDEHLLRLGQPELPGQPCMLEAGQRRRACPAVVAGDQHDVGMRLRHARGDGADPTLGDELHVDARSRIRVLQIEDQLRQVFDGIDIVVRRRRDEADTGRGVAHLRDPRVHLVSRQLAAFARLGALRHLDLQVVGADEVFARHAEAPGSHLLDSTALRIAVRQRNVPLRILATLARVRLAAEPVHRNGERLVRFLADRSVRHRAGREPLEETLRGLDLVDWDRRARRLQPEQPAQRGAVLVLLVDELRVLLEGLELAAARRVLQLEDSLRVEQMVLPVTPPLVFTALFQLCLAGRFLTEGAIVAQRHFPGDHVDADAAETRRGVREVLVDERLAESDRLEDLRAAIARQRGDPHLRHDLEDALVQRLDVVLDRLLV